MTNNAMLDAMASAIADTFWYGEATVVQAAERYGVKPDDLRRQLDLIGASLAKVPVYGAITVGTCRFMLPDGPRNLPE